MYFYGHTEAVVLFTFDFLKEQSCRKIYLDSSNSEKKKDCAFEHIESLFRFN